MEFMQIVIQWIRQGGAPVVLPITLFVMGLMVGIRPGKSLRHALQAGIGYFGVLTLMGVISTHVGPVVQEFSRHMGLDLTVMDMGQGLHGLIRWGAFSGVAGIFSALAMPAGVAVNLVMLRCGATKTINADVWNIWSWMFSGLLIYATTHNWPLAILAFILTGVIAIKLGDYQARAIQESYQMPGVSFPHPFSTIWALLAVPVNWCIEQIPGLRDWSADPDSIQERFGEFGHPSVIGMIVGVLLGLIARVPSVQVIKVGLAIAALMQLLPLMIQQIVAAVMPIGQTMRSHLEKRGGGTEEYYIGLDCALGAAMPISIAVGMLLVPISVLLAAVLPGNKTIPMGELGWLSYAVASAMPYLRMNVVRGVIFGTIVMALSLWMATAISPLFTSLAIGAGLSLPEGATGVTVMLQYPLTWLFGMLGQVIGH